MIDLTGRTAIVTGGGRGIGAAAATLLGRCGANVVVADVGAAIDGTGVDPTPAAQTAGAIRDQGGEAIDDTCDVGDGAQVQALFARTLEQYGHVHVIVNAAGNLRDRMIWNMTEDEWDAVIRVHLRGHFNMISNAAKYWRSVNNPSNHYRVVNFTSGAGIWGSIAQPNYGAAKMGIIGLTYSSAQALARFGGTVNAVAPIAATRMMASIPDDHNGFANKADLSPGNVAPLVAYLASVESSWVTGRILEAGRFSVKLYGYIDEIAAVTTDGPWDLDDLSAKVGSVLRDAADHSPNPLTRILAEQGS